MHARMRVDDSLSVRMHFLHPAPPSPTENDESTERDVELLVVARSIQHSDDPIIVTGDLNDVAVADHPAVPQDQRAAGSTRGPRHVQHLPCPSLVPALASGPLLSQRALPFRPPAAPAGHRLRSFPVFIELQYDPKHTEEQQGLEADRDDQRQAAETIAEEPATSQDVPQPEAAAPLRVIPATRKAYTGRDSAHRFRREVPLAPASDRPALTPDTLRELAFDQSIRWTSQNDDLWQLIDNDLWALTRNPSLILSTVPEQKLEALLRRVDCHRRWMASSRRAGAAGAADPFASQQYGERLARVAYFSMEYMLSEALPIYSGGFGNVAGDQLKAASDLGVPVTAVGMLWQHGYFRQSIGPDGRQQALYPVNDTRQMPIEPLHDASGAPLRLAIQLPGLQIWLRGWQARSGITGCCCSIPMTPPIHPSRG